MKHTKLIGIVVTMAALLFAGCKNGLDPNATVKGEGITTGNQLEITINTNENLKIFNTKKSSRTILTDAFAADNENLFFLLWGTAASGEQLNPKLVDVIPTDAITGKVTLDIDALNWDLTLCVIEAADEDAAKAYEGEGKESAIEAIAVLRGYANVDMQFTNTINFTLSPKGLTKTGTVGLRLVRENDWPIPAGYAVTANLYNAIDMQPVNAAYETDLVNADHSEDKFIKEEDYSDTETANFTANGNEIDPGTYVFEIRVTKAHENREYVWNDTIIILPGKCTDQVTDGSGALTKKIVIPNLIGTKPVSPTDFQVTYVTDDEDKPNPGYYRANFTWDGSAVKTEKNFVLELAELADAQATPAAALDSSAWNTLWSVAANKYTFDYDAMNNATILGTETPNPNYDAYYNRFKASGSLLANNSSITLYLELGKRYIARMYSENNAGKSATPVYMEVQDDSDGNSYTVINRYRVTYHTQSPTASWNTEDNKMPTVVKYWGQSNNPYDVIAPVGFTGADGKTTGDTDHPYLFDGAADWLYWIKDPQTQDKYPYTNNDPILYDPNDYEGYKNLDLYAAYSREGTIIIYDDNKYDILSGWVSGFGKEKGTISKISTNNFSKADGTGTPLSTTVSVNLNTVDAADVDNPSINWKYDKVLFQMTYGGRTYVSQEQVGNPRGTANEFTIYLKTLPTGCVYNCKITAHYKQTVVSYPFTMYITD